MTLFWAIWVSLGYQGHFSEDSQIAAFEFLLVWAFSVTHVAENVSGCITSMLLIPIGCFEVFWAFPGLFSQ